MKNTWLVETTGLTWKLKTLKNVNEQYTSDESLKYAEELNDKNF